jgi:TolB-like protein/Tfp pilus assembly protein PilF
MEPRNGEEQPRTTLENIELDLATSTIFLHFKDPKEPLVLHFDTPSRRFYFALIALVVTEMKHLDRQGFIHIRRHEKTLTLLDHALAGPHASENESGMWEKIRKAWHYTLPDLEEAAHFKILDKDLIRPYEKGGKYRYGCSEEESDTWANLFVYDEYNPWRFKFAVDSVSLDLEDISLSFGDLQDDKAWQGFVKSLSMEPSPVEEKEARERPTPKRWYKMALAAMAILIIAAAGAAIWNLSFRRAPPPAVLEVPDKPSIAVLPFVNISGDPEKEYFSDGITEELINTLARLEGLRVISRTSAFFFKDKRLDISTIGEKFKVEAVLEGSVRAEGNKLRITAQLVKAADDSHLWAATYDREMKDIFAIQEEISQAIVDKLEVKLLGEEAIVRRSTENPEAYSLYMMGRFFWNQWRVEGWYKAKDYYEQALAVDPDFALAYAGLADVYQQLAFNRSLPPRETYAKAKSMALKALEIEDELAEAHASLGIHKLHYEWDWEWAEKSLKRAIELNPGYVVARRYYSEYFRALGRLDEAIKEAKRALETDPFSLNVIWAFGLFLNLNGQLDESITQFQKTLELYPNHPTTLIFLGSAYVDKERFEEGIALLKKAIELTRGESPFPLGFLGYAYGVSGKREEAQEILDGALERSKRGYFSPHFIAMIYAGLGDKDKVFEWLEKAYEERDPRLHAIKTIPKFRSLHSDPRWNALLKKMGLEGD